MGRVLRSLINLRLLLRRRHKPFARSGRYVRCNLFCHSFPKVKKDLRYHRSRIGHPAVLLLPSASFPLPSPIIQPQSPNFELRSSVIGLRASIFHPHSLSLPNDTHYQNFHFRNGACSLQLRWKMQEYARTFLQTFCNRKREAN